MRCSTTKKRWTNLQISKIRALWWILSFWISRKKFRKKLNFSKRKRTIYPTSWGWNVSKFCPSVLKKNVDSPCTSWAMISWARPNKKLKNRLYHLHLGTTHPSTTTKHLHRKFPLPHNQLNCQTTSPRNWPRDTSTSSKSTLNKSWLIQKWLLTKAVSCQRGTLKIRRICRIRLCSTLASLSKVTCHWVCTVLMRTANC